MQIGIRPNTAGSGYCTVQQALQVRYLQTLKEIANEKTNTIVFPMPLELVEPILHLTKSKES